MGKQSKRKNKRRSGTKHRPTGLADDPLTTTTASTNNEQQTAVLDPTTKIISKIRHGDPRVRHASLVALSRTLFDGTSLENAALKNKNNNGSSTGSTSSSVVAPSASNPTLLRALSERILDTDVPCAITAVGCLSNYVSFYCSGSSSSSSLLADGRESDEDVVSIVMVPILLQRLSNSLNVLHLLGSTASSMQKSSNQGATKKKGDEQKKKKKQVAFNNQDTTSTSTDENNKLYLKMNEQYTLLSLSSITLTGIIENCGITALQTCGANAFIQLLSVLNTAVGGTTLLQQQGMFDKNNNDNTMKEEGKEEGETGPVYDTITNASRALHSLLDDNVALISSLPLGSAGNKMMIATAPASPSINAAISQLTNTIIVNTNLPNLARLHASGAILALRRILVLEKEHEQLAVTEGSVAGLMTSSSRDEQQIVTALQSCTNEVIVPYLSSIFNNFNNSSSSSSSSRENDSTKQLLQQMIHVSNQLSSIKHDASMESQIVSQVNSRKEPAREIARRQKMMKKKEKNDSSTVQAMDDESNVKKDESKSKSEAKSEKIEDAAAMVVEEDKDNSKEEEDEEKQQQQQQEDELTDKLNDTVSQWKDTIGSYKLALELVANLCSSLNDEEENEGEQEEEMNGHNNDDDDDEHMWDSDDEAKLLAGATSEGEGGMMGANGTTVTLSEKATYNAMTKQDCDLPMKMLSAFHKWSNFLPMMDSPNATDTTMEVETNAKVPALVSQDVDELLSTFALCLGNVVSCNLVEEKSTLLSFWKGLVPLLESKHHQHVTSVMLSLVRSVPQSRTLVDSSTLECLIAIILQQNQNASNAEVETQTNIISILGVLCSEPHPSSIDTQVCRALLERLRLSSTGGDDVNSNNKTMKDSIIVTHEILNVLMDMYSNDDDDEGCHNEVFVNEDVLGHFQRCLPGFKRRIKKYAAGTRSSGMGSIQEEIEVDLWNETALNASRFIKYKKGA